MKKQILASLILAGSLVVAVSAHAEEKQTANTSSVKVTDVQKKDETVPGDLDQEITNAKMRAESGSKSKWSVSTSLNYNGGNLETPFSAKRPNYAGVSTQDTSTSMSADIAVALRLTSRDQLRLGTGVTVKTPFQNTYEESTNQNGARKAAASAPYISWGRSFRAWNLQQSVGVTGSYETNPSYTDMGYVGTGSVDYTILGEIPNSNWQPGFAVTIAYTGFSDGAVATDTASNTVDGRSDYSIGLYPFIEYAFNDRYSFRTVFRPANFDHYRNDSGDTFYHNMWTQSVGVGIAVTRDIYLYPNFQFAPEYVQADTTNVGMSATINVF